MVENLKQDYDIVEVLPNAYNEAEAIVIKDYPYGFRLRTEIRYWIERTKNGERFVSQTLNPKTGEYNKPKKSVYSKIVKLYKDKNGHVQSCSIDLNAEEEVINEFCRIFKITDEEQKDVKLMIAWTRGMKHITFKIEPSNGEHTQTEEEQKNIISKCVNYEYKKME